MSGDTTEIVVHAGSVACDDGLSMAMDIYHPADPSGPLPVAILCHGFKGFRMWGMFPYLARRLAATGRGVVLFDYSHNGTEASNPEEFTRLDLFEKQTMTRHVEDMGRILGALEDEELRKRCHLDDHGAFAVGHSLGGGVAMMRASNDLRVAGLACLNAVSHLERIPTAALAELETSGKVSIPNARTGQTMPLGRPWFDDIAGIDLEAVADEVCVPTLVLQGEVDSSVLPSEGEALADWIPGNIYVPVPDGDHTFGAKHPWAGWTTPLEVVVDQLDAFLPASEG